LNYNFGLTEIHDVDSARVGNEMRYLNHGRDDEANAHAESAQLRNNISTVAVTDR